MPDSTATVSSCSGTVSAVVACPRRMPQPTAAESTTSPSTTAAATLRRGRPPPGRPAATGGSGSEADTSPRYGPLASRGLGQPAPRGQPCRVPVMCGTDPARSALDGEVDQLRRADDHLDDLLVAD